MFPQLKSGFRRTINFNKCLIRSELLAQNPNINRLIEPIFQWVNRLFVLEFGNDAQRSSNKRYYIPNVEIKEYNVMIGGRNFLDQPIKDYKTTYENIRKISAGQRDD